MSELGLELVDLVHSLLELGVCRVLADAAHGPAQDLRAAVRDACGDQVSTVARSEGPSRVITGVSSSDTSSGALARPPRPAMLRTGRL